MAKAKNRLENIPVLFYQHFICICQNLEVSKTTLGGYYYCLETLKRLTKHNTIKSKMNETI